MPGTDLTPARLRALADEWRMLDLQASMTEAEIARYERLPLLMAAALEGLADWRAGLESEIAGDVECTREQLCAAVDAGADQADIDRLNRAVWTLFDRASALRLVFRRIDPLAARVIELEGEVERLREALRALASYAEPPADVAGLVAMAEAMSDPDNAAAVSYTAWAPLMRRLAVALTAQAKEE